MSWDVSESCTCSLPCSSSSSGFVSERGAPKSTIWCVRLYQLLAIKVRTESSDFLTTAGHWPASISKYARARNVLRSRSREMWNLPQSSGSAPKLPLQSWQCQRGHAPAGWLLPCSFCPMPCTAVACARTFHRLKKLLLNYIPIVPFLPDGKKSQGREEPWILPGVTAGVFTSQLLRWDCFQIILRLFPLLGLNAKGTKTSREREEGGGCPRAVPLPQGLSAAISCRALAPGSPRAPSTSDNPRKPFQQGRWAADILA